MALHEQHISHHEAELPLPYARGIRFKHVADIIKKDLPDLWGISDAIDEGRIITTLISRHRANPAGVGPSLRYDIWQQNPRCRFPLIYLYEPDNGGTPDIPNLVIRDFSTRDGMTDESWQINVWAGDSRHTNPHANILEHNPYTLTPDDIGSVSIGIRMAIDQAEGQQ